jgi:WD40 repeat protein
LDWPGLDHPVVITGSLGGTAWVWDPRRPDAELARFDGHTDGITGVASVVWPGLRHPVVVTTSYDGTARVWDPRQPDTELACFDRHTNIVTGVANLDLADLDYPVVVTTSNDGTARVWDPRQPDTDVVELPIFGTGYRVVDIGPGKLAVATGRGLVIFQIASTPPHGRGQITWRPGP